MFHRDDGPMTSITTAAVTVLLAAVLTPAALAQPAEAELVGLFTKSAESVFERAKAKPTEDCASLLKDLIAEGANRLVSDKRTSDRDIAAVVEIMRRFANEMVKHGARQPDGTIRLGDDSYSAAQRSLCPLYPFC